MSDYLLVNCFAISGSFPNLPDPYNERPITYHILKHPPNRAGSVLSFPAHKNAKGIPILITRILAADIISETGFTILMT